MRALTLVVILIGSATASADSSSKPAYFPSGIFVVELDEDAKEQQQYENLLRRLKEPKLRTVERLPGDTDLFRVSYGTTWGRHLWSATVWFTASTARATIAHVECNVPQKTMALELDDEQTGLLRSTLESAGFWAEVQPIPSVYNEWGEMKILLDSPSMLIEGLRGDEHRVAYWRNTDWVAMESVRAVVMQLLGYSELELDLSDEPCN